jgi:hypothetical protein
MGNSASGVWVARRRAGAGGVCPHAATLRALRGEDDDRQPPAADD